MLGKPHLQGCHQPPGMQDALVLRRLQNAGQLLGTSLHHLAGSLSEGLLAFATLCAVGIRRRDQQ